MLRHPLTHVGAGRYRTRTARPRRRRGNKHPSGVFVSARFPTHRNVYQERCRQTFGLGTFFVVDGTGREPGQAKAGYHHEGDILPFDILNKAWYTRLSSTNRNLWRCFMDKYLKETKMLNYSNANIQQLIRERRWKNINEFERLKSIYDFVRDEILFGYNIDDNVPASKVLADGYGQCNTKGTLFMAILRACNIPCRVHGFTIDKKLQKGAMTGIVYRNAPQNVFHSWVEVYFEDRWYELEAFILDKKYLQKLQEKNSDCKGAFCGYGVAVKDFKNLIIDFDRNNTYIQSEGINQDFGVYDSPDDLLKAHHQEMSAIKAFLYKHFGRHLMNRNVKKIRNC